MTSATHNPSVSHSATNIVNGTFSDNYTFISYAQNATPIVIRGNDTQLANLTVWQTFVGATLASINATGSWRLGGGPPASPLLFIDNNTQRIGIGTASPGERLEVVGNIISKGTSWASRTSAADNNWRSVTYGNGLFVATAINGTGNRVMTSPDGITWTTRTSAADNDWRSVTYGNGLFVAVSETGTGDRVMTSPDGITWTTRTSAANNGWASVTYGNGLFVAVSYDGGDTRVMTSPDGITWTTRTSAIANQWLSVIYGNDLFVAVAASGSNDRVMTSPDGTTWTTRTSATNNDWASVTYGNGLFVAVSTNGTGDRVMTSPNGTTWTTRTSAADNRWGSVTYGNGLFVATATNGTGDRVMTSPDGITWTTRTSAANNDWASVTYGNGLFVAVSTNGTGNRVMTSGKTDYIPFSANNIYQGGMNIFGNVGIGTAAPYRRLQVNGTGGVSLEANESVYLATVGNQLVGIGTTAPFAGLMINKTTPALQVNDSAYLAVSGGSVGIGATSPNATLHILGTGTSGGLRVTNQSNGAEIFFVNSTLGNVGIGTTGPCTLCKLHLVSDIDNVFTVETTQSVSNPIIDIVSVTGDGGVRFKDSVGYAGMISYLHSVDRMEFSTNGTSSPDAVINSAGNVGIGTAAPYRRLQVNGTGGVSLEANESVYLAIGPGQLVGINTTSPRQTLTVAGDANVTGILYVGQQSFTNVDASGNLAVGRNLTVSNNVLFASNLTSRLGINTTSPDSTLAVSGNLSVATGAVLATSSGNVGIGTASPLAKLNIDGIATNVGLVLTNNDVTHGMTTSVMGRSGPIADTNTLGLLVAGVTLNGGLDIFGISDAAGTEGLGLVGVIGSTAPTAVAVEIWGGKSDGAGVGVAMSGTERVLQINTGSDIDGTPTNLVTVQANGNVGIGTTAPYRRLMVNGTGGVSLETNESAYLATGPGQLVGINTTSPRQTLTVIGDINVTGQSYLANLNISGITFGGGNITVSGNVSAQSGIFTSNGAAQLPLAVIGASGQTANLTEWRNSTSYVLAYVNESGGLYYRPFAGYSTRGLVLLMHLNNETADWSGNNNDGIKSGNTNCGTAVSGAIYTACRFDGSSGNVSVLDSASLGFANREFTIEFWMSLAQTNQQHAFPSLASKHDNLVREFLVYYDNATKTITLSLGNNTAAGATANDIQQSSTARILNDTQWHYIAIAFTNFSTASTARFYVDGLLDASRSYTLLGDLPISTSNGIAIGSNAVSGNSTFNGTMDEVAIWNRALSTDEIRNRYLERKTLRGYESGDRIGGNLTVIGNLNVTGQSFFGAQSFSSVDTSGNVNVGANLTVSNNVLFASNLTSRVGINTTTPDSTFAVVGNASIDGSTFYVDAGNNRVGIGTAAPGAALHVSGNLSVNANITGAIIIANGSLLTDIRNSSIQMLDSVKLSNIAFLNNAITLTATNVSGLNNALTLNVSNITSGTFTGDYTLDGKLNITGNVTFNRSTLFIDTLNSRVGIGTASPATLLDVQGAVTINGASVTLSQDTNFVLSGGVNGISFDTNLLSIDALNNRVGFGTTSPANGPFNARGDTDGTTVVDFDNLAGGLGSTNEIMALRLVLGDGSEGRVIGASIRAGKEDDILSVAKSDTFMAFTTTLNNIETEYIRLTSAGRLGIGTIVPLSALDVNGSAAIGTYAGNNAAPSNGLIVSGSVGIGTAAPYRRLQVNGTGGVSLEANESVYLATASGQNVGVRTTSPSAVLHVAGSSTENALNVNGTFIINGTTGNVGIGTTSPNLAGYTGDRAIVSIRSAGSTAGTEASLEIWTGGSVADDVVMGRIDFGDNGRRASIVGLKSGTTGGSMQFNIAGGGTLGMFLDNSGMLGIGTDTPKASLSALNLSIGSSYAVNNIPPVSGAIIQGNVGIGTASPTQRLTVSGHGNFTANLTLGSPSLRNGITMHDTADGSVHCVTISSDALSVSAGACRND